tara:strand:- start:1695 stop:2264 length:570 start_codon:yes stop_codon:yes gene_type:complete
MTTLGAGKKEKDVSLLGGLGGMLKSTLSGGLLGGLVGKTIATNNVAQAAANAIVLREAGRDDLADKLEEQIKTYSKDKGLENVPTEWRNGDRLAATIMEQQAQASKVNNWDLQKGPKGKTVNAFSAPALAAAQTSAKASLNRASNNDSNKWAEDIQAQVKEVKERNKKAGLGAQTKAGSMSGTKSGMFD